jgi:hypothetical protein
VLVDTGLPASREEFLHHLWTACDPAELRWIWLTHPDRDHTGSLAHILEAAPQARLVTTFLGLGILSIEHAIPPQRVFLLNPGQSLSVGDRSLHAFRPPLYDSPATTGLIDNHTGTCFSSDCFGGPMPDQHLALAEDVDAVSPTDLSAAQRLWATVDSPWIADVDRRTYTATLADLPVSDMPLVLSTHLPPARNRGDQLLESATRHARRGTRPPALHRPGPGRAGSHACRIRTIRRMSEPVSRPGRPGAALTAPPELGDRRRASRQPSALSGA